MIGLSAIEKETRLRPARPSDVMEIYRIGRDLFTGIGEKDDWSLAMLASLFDGDPNGRSVVATAIDGKIVGFALGSEMNKNDFYIYWLGVSSMYQGKGIGGALASEIINTAKRLGYSSVVIDTNEKNKLVMQAVIKHGFEKAGSIAYYKKKL